MCARFENNVNIESKKNFTVGFEPHLYQSTTGCSTTQLHPTVTNDITLLYVLVLTKKEKKIADSIEPGFLQTTGGCSITVLNHTYTLSLF